MREQVLAKRYAKALFDLGVEERTLDRFREEIGRLQKAFSMEPSILKLLTLREWKEEKKEQIVVQLVQKLLLSPWVENFLRLLVKRRRIEYFMAVARAFEELVLASEKRVVAKIRSAERTSVESLKIELKKSLERLTHRKVDLEIEEEKRLLGGFQVILGDTIYDASLAGALKQLKEEAWR